MISKKGVLGPFELSNMRSRAHINVWALDKETAAAESLKRYPSLRPPCMDASR
jgi:hypothetical protein